jgi:hypothetical protein
MIDQQLATSVKQTSQMLQRYYQSLKNDTDPRNESMPPNMIQNPSQISPKSIKNLSKIWKIEIWERSGTVLAAGWSRERLSHTAGSLRIGILSENVAPRVDFGFHRKSKMVPKSALGRKIGAGTL